MGPAALPPVSLSFAPVDGVRTPIELPVRGSGVYVMRLTNTNMLSHVTFAAKVEHEPMAARRLSLLRRQLASRQSELAELLAHDKSLAQSEKTLELRLWEVQETRRRHTAMAAQLQEAIREIQANLASPAQDA